MISDKISWMIPVDHYAKSHSKKLKPFRMRTKIMCRMRTGNNPDRGKLQWKTSVTQIYLLPPELVEKYGVATAYRIQERKYYQDIRDGRIKV